MKAAKILLSGIILSTLGITGSAKISEPKTDRLVEGNSRFAFDLYSVLKSEKDNVFFSPYSISTALGMTYAGAQGETEIGMAKVLHFTEGQKKTCQNFGLLQAHLNLIQKKDNIKLGIANAIWAKHNYKFLPEYLDLVQKDFKSKIKYAPFNNLESCEVTRKEINGWVEDKTNDKIKGLIGKGVLTPDTKLVLVNAIYFKGDWLTQFKEKDTNKKGLFYTSPKTKITVPMMYQLSKFSYAEDKSTQIIEMPYKGNETSMVVILPKKKDGIAELEKSLTFERAQKLMQKMRKQEVHVSFPKFKTETKYELAKYLAKMQMKAFSLNADFAGMNGKKTLFISNVIHQAFVEVDEEGTEAAAATAVVMADSLSINEPPIPFFNADHPFIFMIRENTTGSILFMGRMSNPGK